jgi:hypothetical protein
LTFRVVGRSVLASTDRVRTPSKMRIAAAIFAFFGFAYAAWCIVAVIAHGLHVGTVGMALLSVALCHQALMLFRGRRQARRAGIVGAAALALGSGASAALVALPWLSTDARIAIPDELRPALTLLIASAAAFGLATAALIQDRRPRPGHGTERTGDG